MSKIASSPRRIAFIRQFWELYWLPLYIFLSMSWLFGPLVHHDQLHNIAVISHYEAFGQPYGWCFRLCDIAGAFILAAAVRTFGIAKHHKAYAWLLYGVATLAAIDGIFATSALSGVWFDISRIIHNGESVLLSVTVAMLTILDIARRKALPSVLFLALQIAAGLVGLLNFENHSLLVVLQYLYEISLITWVAWLVAEFSPVRKISQTWRLRWRKAFGYWTALNGIVLIVLSVSRLLPYSSHLGVGLEHGYPWVAQHGIIVGVVLLYLSRHVRQGQKRAALLLGAIFVSQIILYSVIRPSKILLLVALTSYILLWLCSTAFDRNRIASKFSSRLSDVVIILAGVIVAVGLVFASAGLVGRQAELTHLFKRAYSIDVLNDAYSGIHHKKSKLEHEALHLSVAGDTLLLMLVLTLLWSIFRPARILPQESDISDKEHVQTMLNVSSLSSEDYFKLWPNDKQYFFNTRRTGFIAYKIVGGIAFALADPVAPSLQQKRSLLSSFLEYCHTHGLSTCFLMVEEKSLGLYKTHLRTAQIGSSAVIDIANFTEQVITNKWWRWRMNRSSKLGYTYQSHLPPHSTEFVSSLSNVSEAWLTRDHHREQSFALGSFDEAYLQQCRIHALYDSTGELVGFTNQLPTYANNTQTTVDLIRFLPEADGAMPTLIAHLLQQLRIEGIFTHFDLGFVPLAKIDSTLANVSRRLAESRFASAGLEQFKGKFKPDWHPNYIAYDGDVINLARIVANLDKVLDTPKE